MENIQNEEAFRVWIMNYLSEKLGKHAILKGGMVLRLLDCPRFTNDLDYVFVPFHSKKEIVPLIREIFEELEGIKLEVKLHSTQARFILSLSNNFGRFKTQIEANVAEDCPAEALSSGDFALKQNQLPHIIRVMRFEIAMAHKLAAWNERRLMRDLYDVYFFYKSLKRLPDLPTLKKRLEKIQYAKRMPKNLPRKMSLEEFWDLFEKELEQLSASALEEELRDSLDAHSLLGLENKIKIALTEMVEKIRAKT